jgi:hypothetical protein
MDSRGLPPETSNFYCLPGRAGRTPNVLARDNPVYHTSDFMPHERDNLRPQVGTERPPATIISPTPVSKTS